MYQLTYSELFHNKYNITSVDPNYGYGRNLTDGTSPINQLGDKLPLCA